MILHEVGRHLFLDDGIRITECSPLEGWSIENKEDVKRDLESGYPYTTGALRFAYECLSITQHDLGDVETSSLGTTAGKRSKIKLHTPNIEEALSAIESSYFVSGFPVRVDCNQKWDYESISELVDEIPNHMIEYIEEPTANYAEKLKLSHRIPIALDETLLHELHRVTDPGAFVFVLKPTLLGPIAPFLDMTPQKAVLSGAYESGIGTRYIINLAKEYPEIAPGVGVGTYNPDRDPILPLIGKHVSWEYSLLC